MLLKRLYDRTDYDPDALARARAELQDLLDAARVDGKRGIPLSKEAAAAIMAQRKRVTQLTPALNGVTVVNTGATPRQNFSTSLVRKAQKEGWLSIDAEAITLHSHTETIPDPEWPNDRARTHEGDYVFRIERGPGYYCCHCGAELEDAGARQEDGRTAGQHHVTDFHGDAESPDPNNPAGYRLIDHYETVLEG